MTDTLYFSADEVMKGIRLLWNDLSFANFKRELFPEKYHTEEYVQGWFKQFGDSPFHFWCSIDDTKRKKLNFLIDEAAGLELHRERKATQKPLLEALDKVMD
tara:strand:+ start:302 stop:607 length:306 start_codon:yes stop_codon:yes gene_type:complete